MHVMRSFNGATISDSITLRNFRRDSLVRFLNKASTDARCTDKVATGARELSRYAFRGHLLKRTRLLLFRAGFPSRIRCPLTVAKC